MDQLVMFMCSLLLRYWKMVFSVTSAFSWQNSISLCPASFRIPRPNLPVRSWTVLWRPTRPFRTNTPKRCPFHYRDWNAKVGSQEIPGVTGKFHLGVQNEAGQRLTEFCQENTLVIADTLFQQHKRWLYTWTSPAGPQNYFVLKVLILHI